MADLNERNPTAKTYWTCEKYEDDSKTYENSFCYWKAVTCEVMDLEGSFDLKIGDQSYSIPIKELTNTAQSPYGT